MPFAGTGQRRDGDGATTNASANANAAVVTVAPRSTSRAAQIVSAAAESGVGAPRGRDSDQAVALPPQHRDLGEPAFAGLVAPDVQQHLHCRGELTVQREAVEAAESCEGLEPGGHFGGIVRVDGSRAAVVTGVEGGQQVDHLRAPHLADDDPVRSHPQRLPHQVADGNLAHPFDIRAARDQLHQVRMSRFQLGGVLHADDAFLRRHLTEDGRQERGLARAGAAGDKERQPGGDDPVQQCGCLRGDRARPASASRDPVSPAAAPATTGKCRRRRSVRAPRAAGR